MKKNKVISVIGPSKVDNPQLYTFAEDLGKMLIDNGFFIVSGGKTGIMEAVFKGAHLSDNYIFGKTIAIIPENAKDAANTYSDIVIPTGIGYARNQIVVNSGDIIIALAGATGTLSEIAFAWQYMKPIIFVTKFDGWAKELANKQLDTKRDMTNIFSAKSVKEIEDILIKF